MSKFMGVTPNYSSNKQILITTHSPTTLPNFDINNVYLVTKDNTKNTQIEILTPDNAGEVIEQLGIKPSDILDYDLIIFVEGEYDVDVFKVFAKKLSIKISTFCFIPTDGWTNIGYYVNSRILQKLRVQPKIIAIFDGDIDKYPNIKEHKERMIKKMQIPEDNIFTLSRGEIECYLLDVAAWYKAWPDLKQKTSEEELIDNFDKIIKSENQKEDMEKLMRDLTIGDYTRERAVKIVENITKIPDEIEKIFQKIKALTKN